MHRQREPLLPNPVDPDLPDPVRRRLLRYGAATLGVIASGQLLVSCRNGGTLFEGSRPLQESGVEGLRVPAGFSARVIARTGESVLPGSPFRWHAAPDGGAVFSAGDGGWIYVSNSEMDDGAGGASAVRFDASGTIVDAYPVLTGTHRNCAGGPTPWNTWLSCEEVADGRVWECDPSGRNAPRALPALGLFMHEAVAVDPVTMQLYLTEDRPDGRFYRFTPAAVINGIPELQEGVLEVAQVEGGDVRWLRIEDPSAAVLQTREQVPESTAFAGGEGAWYADGAVYFTTKHDNRVWAYEIESRHLAVIYDDDRIADATLTGVDNITVSQTGTVYVAEDGGNMQIVGIDRAQRVFPVVQLLGHERSEVTGPALDASGKRLYFSSQRGARGTPLHGVTYEVTGPFG